MNDKSINFVDTTQQLVHRLPAGIVNGDKSTEIFACRTSKSLFAISDGKTDCFSTLPPEFHAQLLDKLLSDEKAINDLKNLSQSEALKEYTFCIYGAADSEADFCSDGILKNPDNFLCSSFCKCLHWNSKSIAIDGNVLTIREIQIIQLLASDLPDKQIASELNISVSTLDTHKNNLFIKANVKSKAGLIVKAITNKIIQ